MFEKILRKFQEFGCICNIFLGIRGSFKDSVKLVFGMLQETPGIDGISWMLKRQTWQESWEFFLSLSLYLFFFVLSLSLSLYLFSLSFSPGVWRSSG